MSLGTTVLIFVFAMGALAYARASRLVWTIVIAVVLAIETDLHSPNGFLFFAWLSFVLIAAALNFSFIRRQLIAKPIFNLYKKFMPKMSDTEKQALEAGDVWWDGELFSGAPNWSKLYDYSTAKLTEEEQAFLDGPVQELCEKINDYQISIIDKKIPSEIWTFIKEKGFLGLVIPKKYGGLGFSQYAHGCIAVKVYSVSITVGTSVGVPNSLGPAELLLHYGTDAQKDYYLPRLAKGQEIPCFALTGPEAGSDAGSMPDIGVICRGEFQGKQVLGMRLNFSKRYITLAPIATVIGLAFKLEDPENLLGMGKFLGITCALLPRDTEGLDIGRRHWPANNPFQNGPMQGRDIFLPLDAIIGGPKMAGQGWRMLMECLSIGRAISLPATGVACSKFAAITTGAYARVRKQFGVPIAKFEIIAQILGQIGANAYTCEAAFKMTLSALEANIKPAVPSAILKYHLTELGRKSVIGAMDVHAGKAVMMGPSNYLAGPYHGVPIAITVEGANPLTLALIIFGQGAMRCHPNVLAEVQALAEPNADRALRQFDKAFFAHLGFFTSNMVRSLWFGLTGARFVRTPAYCGLKRYHQYLTRFSSAFACAADMAMFTMGGDLKRKEQISARFANVLSHLYLSSAVLKHYVVQGEQKEDYPLVVWSVENALYEIQTELDGIISNLPNRIAALVLRVLIFPFGRHFRKPADKIVQEIAESLSVPGSGVRTRLGDGIFKPQQETHNLSKLEEAFKQAYATESIEKILLKAIKEQQVDGFAYEERIAQAQAKGILLAADAEKLLHMNELRKPVIGVDDFAADAVGIVDR